MLKYEGTKRLSAKPMTLGEYNEYRRWAIPANENPADAGYLVEYEDGGKANDSRHVGYISWSPADVFERAYKRVLAPHQQRVVAEATELNTKLDALVKFLGTPMYAGLDLAERDRLAHQSAHMHAYARVLRERIAAF